MTREEAIYLLRNTAWLAPSGTLESVEEAVDMATEALKERPKGEWIPCSERLPLPDDNPVIVSWMGVVNIGWYSCGRWETGTRLPMDGVEAWMPMPEAMKTGDD